MHACHRCPSTIPHQRYPCTQSPHLCRHRLLRGLWRCCRRRHSRVDARRQNDMLLLDVAHFPPQRPPRTLQPLRGWVGGRIRKQQQLGAEAQQGSEDSTDAAMQAVQASHIRTGGSTGSNAAQQLRRRTHTCRQSAPCAASPPSGGRSSRATTAVLSCPTACCREPSVVFMPLSDCSQHQRQRCCVRQQLGLRMGLLLGGGRCAVQHAIPQ